MSAMLLVSSLSFSMTRAAQPADLKELAVRATNEDDNAAKEATAELRAAGPAGWPH
ncbi:MAG TPA: hypothetical protein VGI81_25905 [Tepidisphaeraceae bacterium]